MGRPKLVPKPVPKSRTASGPFLKPKPIWQKAKSKELLPEKTAGGSTFFGKPNLIHRDEAWWLGGSCQTRLRNNCSQWANTGRARLTASEKVYEVLTRHCMTRSHFPRSRHRLIFFLQVVETCELKTAATTNKLSKKCAVHYRYQMLCGIMANLQSCWLAVCLTSRRRHSDVPYEFSHTEQLCFDRPLEKNMRVVFFKATLWTF